jgi:hypothetical protein
VIKTKRAQDQRHRHGQCDAEEKGRVDSRKPSPHEDQKQPVAVAGFADQGSADDEARGQEEGRDRDFGRLRQAIIDQGADGPQGRAKIPTARPTATIEAGSISLYRAASIRRHP